jgi:uncharacterized protein (DUF1697 family)
MARFVALLRGINVGGAKRMPMAELRELLASLGYRNVRTLLASGNVVFDADHRSRPAALRTAIEQAVAARFGFATPVLVKSQVEFAAIAAGNPLAAEVTDPSRLLVVFASESAELARLAEIEDLATPPERFVIGKQAAYLHAPAGILESRCAEALLGARGKALTTRNWATVGKLLALLNA